MRRTVAVGVLFRLYTWRVVRYNNFSNIGLLPDQRAGENMEVLAMTEKEMMQRNIEEFARLQKYMKLSDKNSEAYSEMKDRYIELKVILTASGINLTELDKIKE